MTARHHIDELQSLRGVAVLIVVVSHMSSVYLLPEPLRIAIDFVFNAHASIIVFFVLSGFVLTRSLLRRGIAWPNVFGFYVARLFRLLPALWVASAVSAVFLLCYPQLKMHPTVTLWFWLYLHPFPSWLQLALAAVAVDKSLIMPVWTVFIEFMGSAILPIMVAVALNRRRLFVWAVIATGVAAYLLAYAPHRLNSLVYLFDFALGVWLGSRDWKWFSLRPLRKVFCSALILIFFRFLWFSIRNRHLMPLYGYDDPIPMLVESIASFFLIGALVSEHGRVPFLRARWIVWVGDVSYSLYLVHFPVAILTAKLLSRWFTDQTRAVVATAFLMPIGLLTSFALAFAKYRYVEVPSIALGKKAAQNL